MKKIVLVVFALVTAALMTVSCSKDQTVYYRLKYEASSDPDTNMYIQYQHPGYKSLFGSGGSYLLQDCGYVADGFEAVIKAEAVPVIGLDQDVTITLRILVDGRCVAETTGTNSAAASYSIISPDKN